MLKLSSEKKKAEDPRELQKRIRDLSAEIGQLKKSNAAQLPPTDPDRLKKEFERGANSVKRELARELRQYTDQMTKLFTVAGNALTRANLELSQGAEAVKAFELPKMPSLEGIIEQAQAEPVLPAPDVPGEGWQ